MAAEPGPMAVEPSMMVEELATMVAELATMAAELATMVAELAMIDGACHSHQSKARGRSGMGCRKQQRIHASVGPMSRKRL